MTTESADALPLVSAHADAPVSDPSDAAPAHTAPARTAAAHTAAAHTAPAGPDTGAPAVPPAYVTARPATTRPAARQRPRHARSKALLRRGFESGLPPMQVGELELARPVATLRAATAPGGRAYPSAHVLVRLHGDPIGVVQVDLGDGDVPADRLLAQVDAELGEAVERHLAADGLTRHGDGLPAHGLDDGGGATPCLPQIWDDPPLVSVVVATCRRARLLADCLERLLASDYPRFEVLVVDNAPDDLTTRRMLEARYGDVAAVRYLREPTPGLSRARNLGLRHARGPIVAFTDDDVLVDRGWISAIAGAFAAHPDAAVVTGLVMPHTLDTAPQVWLESMGSLGKGFTTTVFDTDRHRDAAPLFPYALGRYGSGANMAFRSALLDDSWTFDVHLGAGSRANGGEDIDSYLDLLLRGRQLVYEPRALLRHRHRADYDGLRRQMFHYGMGLTATIVKHLVARRGHRLDLVRKIPHGVRHALADGSRHAPRTSDAYSRDLQRQEWLGMVIGPIGYARARLWQARLRRLHQRTDG